VRGVYRERKKYLVLVVAGLLGKKKKKKIGLFNDLMGYKMDY
jgi:reverse gyrase